MHIEAAGNDLDDTDGLMFALLTSHSFMNFFVAVSLILSGIYENVCMNQWQSH